MPNTHHENIAILDTLVSRNRERVITIDAAAFWLNDVGETDTDKQIALAFVSQKNWLKCTQPFGKKCTVYPVDGTGGVLKDPPPVQNPNDFVLTKGKDAGKRVGSCDVLLASDAFYFMELKLNATGESMLQMAENREKASLQLARTLTYFRENTVEGSFTAQNCICMIAVPNFYQYPRIAKTNNIAALKRTFIKKYKTDLQEITPNNIIALAHSE
jgi:hypothetical protein